MRLLLVEDDVELANGLVSALEQAGYAADSAQTGAEAIAACDSTPYQTVILDLGLPDMDGIEVLRRLRHRGMSSPVLVLTARDELQDRVAGLDAGADDYLPKPFHVAELEARIRALLRRGESAATMLRVGALTFEPASRRMLVGDDELALTARELAVLELLMRRAGKIVNKKHIFDSIYSWDTDASLSMIEVFVSRLRRKLSDAHAGVSIRGFRGLGYRLEQAHKSDEGLRKQSA